MEPQTLVWVKVDAYPWWPGIVVDHAASGIALEEGKTNLVQFLHTHDAGFVNGNDTSEVAMFDLNNDGAKIAASSCDEGCAAAVEEARALWEQAYQATSVPSAHAEPSFDADLGVAQQEVTKKEKHEKKEKRDKRQKREKKEKEQRRRRDDDDDSDDEERRRRKAAQREMRRTEGAAAATKQSNNDKRLHHAAGAASQEGGYDAMNKAAAIRLASLGTKRAATDLEIRALRKKLEQQTKALDQHGAREVLSALASIRVTYQQLKTTKIGVAVGALLSGDFPYCRMLAESILKFWFAQLPLLQKQRLTDEDRLERASKISVEGDDEDVPDMSLLHAFGVQVERCFMVEEEELLLEEEGAWNQMQRDGDTPGEGRSSDANATPPPTSAEGQTPLAQGKALIPAAHIARVVEEAMGDAPDEMKQFVLNYLGSSDHRQARLDLLKGTTTAESFTAGIKASWHAAIDGGGIKAGPVEDDVKAHQAPPNTILDETVEDEYPNVSHMFTCRECGAASASTSEILRGGHGEDHIVVTLATCTKCHHSWTIGE